MGQAGVADQPASRRDVSSPLPEETQYLVHDALNCFSLVQVLNGAIASLVTLAGYLYKQGNFAGEGCTIRTLQVNALQPVSAVLDWRPEWRVALIVEIEALCKQCLCKTNAGV